ncbi:MAG: hypothetical protein J0H49_37615, partial [Acidobacteria bacterium]|nr:hypothetical protein [Acidobacteriota bacterium]
SAIDRPPSISLIAAIFNSRLYTRRAKFISLSVQCIRPLNFVSQFWGAVQTPATPSIPLGIAQGPPQPQNLSQPNRNSPNGFA